MRIFLRLLLALIIILLAAWLGLWWYAEGRMQAGITNWVSQTSKNPQMKITYDSMKRGGSPLAATVTLTDLRITSSAPLAPVSAVLPSFTMRIDASEPLLVHYDLPSQINLVTPRGNVALTFGSIAATQHLDPNAAFNAKIEPFKSNDIEASNIDILYNGSLLILHADSFKAHGTVDRNAKAGQTALAATENLDGVALSPLLTRLGSVPFDGKISHLGFKLNVTGPVPANLDALQQQLKTLPPGDKADRRKLTVTALHEWAAGGGSANGNLILAIGPTTLNADGAVKFDAKVQPVGTANVTAGHLDAFSAALTQAYPRLQGMVAFVQAQASPWLSASNAGGQTLTMHIAYGNGAVNINGQKARNLPPVDWTALENPTTPPPPPAQAPGDGSGAAAP